MTESAPNRHSIRCPIRSFRRTNFVFRHKKQGALKLIPARNEESAWRKMRKFVFRMLYGYWSLTYCPKLLDDAMKEIELCRCHKCRKLLTEESDIRANGCRECLRLNRIQHASMSMFKCIVCKKEKSPELVTLWTYGLNPNKVHVCYACQVSVVSRAIERSEHLRTFPTSDTLPDTLEEYNQVIMGVIQPTDVIQFKDGSLCWPWVLALVGSDVNFTRLKTFRHHLLPPCMKKL